MNLIKLKKEASLEPSLALLRRGLDDFAPQKICGSTAPLKTALSVNFKKKRKWKSKEEGKRERGRQKGEEERVVSGRVPGKGSKKRNNAKCRTW